MKTTKRLLSIFSVITLLIAVFAVPVLATEPNVFYENTVNGKIDSSAFISGENPNNQADVKGISFVTGFDVKSGGTSEYTMAAGYNVLLTGETENDVFAAGRNVYVNGTVWRDCYATGQDIIIDGEVGRNLYTASQNVIVNGNVAGDLYVAAESITVADGAKIGGKIHCESTTTINAPQKVIDNADITQVTDETETAEESKSVFSIVLDNVLSYLGIILIALVLFWLTPLWAKVDSEYTGRGFANYAKSFGIGFAVLVAVPIASVLLMISQIGLRFALALIMAYSMVLIVAPIFAGFFAGVAIWRKLFKKQVCIWAELLIGIAVIKVLSVIPYVNVLVGIVSICLGLGTAFGLVIHSKNRKEIAE